ncbi:CoA pyrophosphatase [Alloalcanivorax xenomutans]|uniref:NUDIX hydrolase n=1 Tax=Alloalcanivorax xenomutans TaxID=1094342 RepID=UPI003A7FAC0D
MTDLERLRRRLPDYRLIELPLDLPEAAVLMPFVDKPEPELILTVRSRSMPTHAGEVAFPGGKRDPSDRNLMMTALRESQEEVGLAREAVEVLGNLSPIPSRRHEGNAFCWRGACGCGIDARARRDRLDFQRTAAFLSGAGAGSDRAGGGIRPPSAHAELLFRG